MKPLTIALAASTAACVLALAWVLGTPAPADPRVAKLESELREARDLITQLRRDLANKPAAALPSPNTTGLSASRLQLGTPDTNAPASGQSQGLGGALRQML